MRRIPHVPSRLLIGDDRISNNPKLNNLVKGWRAAAHDWIIMADSNVLMPPDYIDRLMERTGPGVGLVCSPPLGTAAGGRGRRTRVRISQHLPGALAIDRRHASTRDMRRARRCSGAGPTSNAPAGLPRYAAAIAEDIAATHLLRKANLKVRLVGRPFPQPLGTRSFAEVWSRQLRWAQLRRSGLFPIFLLEPLTFSLLAFVLGGDCASAPSARHGGRCS